MKKKITPVSEIVVDKDFLEEVRSFIKKNDIILFMKGYKFEPSCKFSKKVVDILLNEIKVNFLGVNLLKNEDVSKSIKIISNFPTVPQLYVKGKFIGGADIIEDLHEKGELLKLLKENNIETNIEISKDEMNAMNENRDIPEAVKLQIEDLITKNKVVLFMKGSKMAPNCGFSAAVVNILINKLNIDFESVNILEDQDLREGIKIYSDWPTIPQLYVNGEFIGGCDIVRDLYKTGELAKILEK